MVKIHCPGSDTTPAEVRIGHGQELAKCARCGRIGKPRIESGFPEVRVMRKHSGETGKRTASYDNTMAILWDGAVPLPLPRSST